MKSMLKIMGECELDGFVDCPSLARGVVVHFHGLAGNFYENPFVATLSTALTSLDFGMLTANSRGHDYLADVMTAKGNWLSRGAAHTIFDEYVDDIKTWLSWAADNLEVPLYVSCHSSAAAAVAAALRSNSSPVAGLVLISPADVPTEVSAASHSDRFAELAEIASKMVHEGQGDCLMPQDALEGYPLDAAVFAEMTLANGPWGWSSLVEGLGGIRTLVVLADGEFTDGAQLESLRSSCQVVRLEGAGHSYRGYEVKLANAVCEFVAGRQS